MNLFGKVLLGLSPLLFSNLALAKMNFPCAGAPGSYRMNPDQSEGGFVAGTAYVDASVTTGPETSVCDRAVVLESVKLIDKARVSGKATVRGDVIVSDEAEIGGEAYVINAGGGILYVKNNAKVYGHGFLNGSVVVADSAEVFGWGKVIEFAQVLGTSKVCGKAIAKQFEILTDSQSKCVQKK